MADNRTVGTEFLGRIDEGKDGHRGAAHGRGPRPPCRARSGARPGPRPVVDEDDDIVQELRIFALGRSAMA